MQSQTRDANVMFGLYKLVSALEVAWADFLQAVAVCRIFWRIFDRIKGELASDTGLSLGFPNFVYAIDVDVYPSSKCDLSDTPLI